MATDFTLNHPRFTQPTRHFNATNNPSPQSCSTPVGANPCGRPTNQSTIPSVATNQTITTIPSPLVGEGQGEGERGQKGGARTTPSTNSPIAAANPLTTYNPLSPPWKRARVREERGTKGRGPNQPINQFAPSQQQTH